MIADRFAAAPAQFIADAATLPPYSLDGKADSVLWLLHRNMQRRVEFPMGLFKSDLFRSLALGFALGAVIVFSALGINPSSKLANGVAPSAEAAAAR